VSREPDYFSWPFVFVVKLSKPTEELEEAEFWKVWLENWNPSREWLQ
jgi:hypothetical protein